MVERGRDAEFYVGYQASAPPGIARHVRTAVLAVFGVVLAVAMLLATRQAPFGSGVFEFGVEREFQGIVAARPYPALLVLRPGVADEPLRRSHYLLVDFGKRGATESIAAFDGQAVRLRGALIYRDGKTLIELVAGSVEALSSDAAAGLRLPAAADVVELGEATLVGEIVDTKCWLGVMKPASLKPHRACAVRCISGGIPPMLIVRDVEGSARHFLLVGADGRALHRDVLDFVAEPVEIRGRVTRHGNLLVLHAEPTTFRRL